jgi:hypothetical protein
MIEYDLDLAELWEAVQNPRRLIVCTLDDVPPHILEYFSEKEVEVVTGIDSLIPRLDQIICDKVLLVSRGLPAGVCF